MAGVRIRNDPAKRIPGSEESVCGARSCSFRIRTMDLPGVPTPGRAGLAEAEVRLAEGVGVIIDRGDVS